MKSRDKVFVLGLDGARLDFINTPDLPNFQAILAEGSSGKLFSRPALTPAAWTSMVTGKNPGKHGIFDFRVGEELLFATHKKAKELWDYVPSVVINVPMTYPAKKINGVMISGMMSPDLDSDLVYPEEERQYLKRLGYIIEPGHDLNLIQDSILKRIEMIKHYFNYEWQLFFVVFREFDVLHHFFWGQEREFYKLVDDFLGDFLVPRLNTDDIRLVIVSDHGFAPVKKALNVELLLKQFGYDKFYLVGGWGALYKNAEIQLPAKQREQIINDLRSFSYQNQQILDVYRNEEIYWGPYAQAGPDLLVWPKRELGYTFQMRSDKVITDSAPRNGCHLEHGLVVLYNFSITRREKLLVDIKDIFPTIMQSLGCRVKTDVDGQLIS